MSGGDEGSVRICEGWDESSLVAGFWLSRVGSWHWGMPWVPFYSFYMYVKVLAK